MSVRPATQNDVFTVNGGLLSFSAVQWLNALVYGHIGDAATLEGVAASGYALAAHTHAGVYAPAGTVVDEPWDGGHFSWSVAAGCQITRAYTINGTVLTMLWQIDASTTTAGAASLTMRIPGLYAAALSVSGFHTYQTAAGGWDVGPVETAVGSGNVTLYTRTRTAWPAEAGTIYTRGQLTLEIA